MSFAKVTANNKTIKFNNMNAVLLATEQWGHNLYGICICDFQNIYTYEKRQ